MEFSSIIGQGIIIEEVNTFLFNMPVEYALGHCVAQDMRMSAGIALYFKLMNSQYNYQIAILNNISNNI